MLVEIWSDVVCPWCYIGKRRFETALAGFAERDQVEVVWRAYELDPNAPARREGDPAERLARKYGISVDQARASQAQLTELAATEGLDYHLDRAAGGNTFDAHRLIHLAADAGLGDAMKERLLRAYLVEAAPIGDRATLVALAGEVGIDPETAEQILAGDDYTQAVRADELRAREIDVTGVPFFLFDGRLGIAGAQSPDLLGRVLERAWVESRPVVVMANDLADDAACSDDGCTI
jgi:predicted DsbA family dithiol-disulfide isomerase